MKIIVDGDGCAGRTIIEKVAKSFELLLIIFCDIHHIINSEYAEVKVVDSGFQSVDMYVVNNCGRGDIVVTQDYGVAALCLPKGAKCISPSGYIFDDKNIEGLLMERHIKSEIRRAGGRTSNPKKRTAEDDRRLEENLFRLIRASISEQ
ncbi:YaiI/YqxD family protein [Clostridium thermarum]|uniref:YaiI/YqxD family protein n=1 Tax=Clostridium thermarum TaxID=1716543 RepID=UPI00112343B5|nr:YaiI/YqxD family protein [Clostridium thermarum]